MSSGAPSSKDASSRMHQILTYDPAAVRDLRYRRGWTTAHVSHTTGISMANLQAIERGQRTMTVVEAQRLLTTYGDDPAAARAIVLTLYSD